MTGGNFRDFSNGYASSCGSWMQNAEYIGQIMIVQALWNW